MSLFFFQIRKLQLTEWQIHIAYLFTCQSGFVIEIYSVIITLLITLLSN